MAKRTLEQTWQLLTGLLTAALGAACSSVSTRAEATTVMGALEPRSGAHGRKPVPAHEEGHDPAGAHDAFADAEAWARVFDDPTRDDWQRPDEVLRALELEPSMTVADIGAGTGYFSVRLARAVPRGEVIATDLQPDMVRFLRERGRREKLLNLRALQASPAVSGLAAQSVDRILVVHVWHHLANRREYARDLATALRPGGRVVVVDFSASARRGPPASLRVAPEAVVAEFEGAGLLASISPIAPPDQYIVEARRRP